MNAFTAIYRPGRYAVWLGLTALLVGLFGGALQFIFRPPTWVLFATGLALAFVVPTPKWVRR